MIPNLAAEKQKLIEEKKSYDLEMEAMTKALAQAHIEAIRSVVSPTSPTSPTPPTKNPLP